MSGQELPALQAIERFIGQKIPRLKLENFPYLYTALFESESRPAAGAHRRRENPSRLFIRTEAVTRMSQRRIGRKARPLLRIRYGSENDALYIRVSISVSY